MKFRVDYLIRFQHCDPAGIVFYPRYYEMLNQVVEDWFAQGLNWSFAMLARDRQEGIPLVHAECDFRKASQIGDVLTFELAVSRLGTRSFDVAITASHEGELRLEAKLVLVYVRVGREMNSIPIPPELRRSMEQYLA